MKGLKKSLPNKQPAMIASLQIIESIHILQPENPRR